MSVSHAIFVCYPNCSTCKKAQRWLDDHEVAYEIRNIKSDKPSLEELGLWSSIWGLPLRKLFNTSGALYRELGVKARLDAGMSDQEILDLLASDGMLVKRPILIADTSSGTIVLVGFKEAEWSEALL